MPVCEREEETPRGAADGRGLFCRTATLLPGRSSMTGVIGIPGACRTSRVNRLLDTRAVPNNYRGCGFEGLSRLPTCRLFAQKAWRVRERQGVRGGPNRREVTRSARPLPHRFERPDRQAPRRRRRRPARARPEPSQRRGDPWARSHRGGYVAGAIP